MPQSNLMRFGLECSFQHCNFNWCDEGSWVGFPYYGAEFYENLARTAARGLFDMMFFGDAADTPEAYGGNHREAVKYGFQWPKHDMSLMIPLLARAAPGLGFGLTMSTTYHHPFHVARLFATLDHLTQGRIAWNAVTSAFKNEAANWGYDKMMPHAQRYARAREHLRVVKALWASVEPDAIILDRASGIFADPDKVHRIDHKGEYFSLPGPLPVMPSVQGGPPIIQAGQSEDGMDLCSRFADLQFAARGSIEGMRAHRANLDARLVAKGRDPRDIGIMWMVRACVGETREEALERDEAWLDSLPPRADILNLSSFFSVDFSKLDGEMTMAECAALMRDDIGHTGIFDEMIKTAGPDAKLAAYARKHMTGGVVLYGSAKQIADQLEDMHAATGANGGFMLAHRARPTPHYLSLFVDFVVPELRRRGLTKTHYAPTLRENLMS